MTKPTLYFENGVYDPKRSRGLEESGIKFSETESSSLIFPAGTEAIIVDHLLNKEDPAVPLQFTRELQLEKNARLEYCLLQDGIRETQQEMNLRVRQGEGSSFRGHVLTLGEGRIANDLKVSLEAEGAECRLDGLYAAAGEARVENHLAVDHLKPHGTSRLFFKGILGGRARAVFHGRVVVHKGAVKTDADQTNKNLLLSREAEADPRPELEIYNNDVKCSHGATVGRLDEAALFYLRSRGIAARQAQLILTKAFAEEVLRRFSVAEIREYGTTQLEKRLAIFQQEAN